MAANDGAAAEAEASEPLPLESFAGENYDVAVNVGGKCFSGDLCNGNGISIGGGGVGGGAGGLGGNPFKGKSPLQVDEMLRNKGFVPRGPDPLNGKGTYVNPRSGRPYHIDANHPPPKPPHVGVGRPRGFRDSNLPKSRDFDF